MPLPDDPPAKPWLGYALLAAWALVGVLGIGSLAVSHTVPMPPPDEETKLKAAALALRHDASKPFLVHVIYANCSCTGRLFNHLLKRGPLPGTEETILFVGRDAAKQKAVESRGFTFNPITAEQLTSHFGLESAPVLLVFNPAGEMRYVGGYFDSPAAVHPLDERLVAEAQRAPASPLPVFGCAVSAKLQKAVDPLGIVY